MMNDRLVFNNPDEAEQDGANGLSASLRRRLINVSRAMNSDDNGTILYGETKKHSARYGG